MHALKLRQNNETTLTKDLLRFAQVFSQMLHVGVTLEQHYVNDVLKAAILELERNKKKIDKNGPEINQEILMVCIFYFIPICSFT